MHSEDIVVLFFITLIAIICVGLGFLVYSEGLNNQEARVACINSGKSWIEGTCVKVAP